MRILGVILVLLGFLAIAYGGITYTKREKVLDMGSIQATVDHKKRIPMSPVAGAVALAAGVALLIARPRRTA